MPKLKTPKSANTVPENLLRIHLTTAHTKSRLAAPPSTAENQTIKKPTMKFTIKPTNINSNQINTTNTTTAADNTQKPKINEFKNRSALQSKQQSTLKSRLIKEWAFREIKNSDLGIDTPGSVVNKRKSAGDLETPSSRLRNQSVSASKELLKEVNDAYLKLEHYVDLATLDDGAADVQIDNRNRALNVSKEMSKKSQEARVLDHKLVELSKDRFKKLSWFECQRKGFVERQLTKSVALPGLK
jgi:hypothetical protein